MLIPIAKIYPELDTECQECNNRYASDGERAFYIVPEDKLPDSRVVCAYCIVDSILEEANKE